MLRLLNLTLLLCTVALIAGCAQSKSSVQRASGFGLYSGNGSLPPEYQDVTTLDGTFDDDAKRVVINFEHRVGAQTESRTVTLTAADYDRVRAITDRTTIPPRDARNIQVGGDSFNVTLRDGSAEPPSGEPANRSEWEEVLALVTARR